MGFKVRDVADLLTLYGVTDDQVRDGMLSLARQANAHGWWSKYGDILPDWFEAYLGLEGAASLIRTFELQFVHGLFQTEAYARAVTLLGHKAAPGEEIDRRVSLRMKRQDLLTGPQPPRVWSVIDEAALRRPLGGRAVMRAQINRLIEVARLPHVTVQVAPFRRGGHAGAGGSFTVLRFAEPGLPDVVYIEQLTSALYLEKREDVDHYMEVMNRLSAEALTPAGYRAVPQGDHPGDLARDAVPARLAPHIGSSAVREKGTPVTSEGAPAPGERRGDVPARGRAAVV